MTGDTAGARTADEHLARLAALPADVLAATDLYSDGEWARAEAVIRPFLLRHPQHVEAMRLLGRIGLELDVLDDAEFLLETVLELDPDYRAARYDYVRVLLKRHKHAGAMTELERLLAVDPDDIAYRTTYATTAASLGNPERGEGRVDRADLWPEPDGHARQGVHHRLAGDRDADRDSAPRSRCEVRLPVLSRRFWAGRCRPQPRAAAVQPPRVRTSFSIQARASSLTSRGSRPAVAIGGPITTSIRPGHFSSERRAQ